MGHDAPSSSLQQRTTLKRIYIKSGYGHGSTASTSPPLSMNFVVLEKSIAQILTAH